MSSKVNIAGKYQHAGSSTLYSASAVINELRQLCITCEQTGEVLCQSDAAGYRYGSIIPGLPVEVRLRDGAVFLPDDASFRWPAQAKNAGWAARLESHKVSIVAAVLLSPLLLWWIIVDLMPIVASAAVPLVPDSVKQQMGKQTFYALQQTALKPSELPASSQAMVHYHWQMALQKLPLSHRDYRLYMYKSAVFGANAFALPDGTVVITDDLVTLLQSNPDAIVAVLLHEIGHVEGQHSVRLVAQSIGATLVLSVLFGNPDGVADLLLGSSSVLLENAFSRDMEREADDFALRQLQVLGKSPQAFADAMSALLNANNDDDNSHNQLLKYLSTHPDTTERIKRSGDTHQ